MVSEGYIEEDFKTEEEAELLHHGNSSKSKRAKNTSKSNFTFIMKFVVGFLIFELYFFINWLTERSHVERSDIIGQEMNVTGMTEPYFWLA